MWCLFLGLRFGEAAWWCGVREAADFGGVVVSVSASWRGSLIVSSGFGLLWGIDVWRGEVFWRSKSVWLNRMMSDYKVEMVNDGMSEFYVVFHGPRDSMVLSFQILVCLSVSVSEASRGRSWSLGGLLAVLDCLLVVSISCFWIGCAYCEG
jgi:hypothetical protein